MEAATPHSEKLLFTDHRIQSRNIFFFTTISISIILALILIAEYFIDLRATSFLLLFPFLIGFLIITILFKYNVNHRVLTILNLTTLFGLIEVHAIANPSIFHVVIYWMGFVPIIAIITTGIRQSFIWMLICAITILIDGLYFSSHGYENYEVVINADAFMVSGIIFSFSIYITSFLLYQLLGNAYTQLKSASEELSRLNLASAINKEKLGRFVEVIFGLSKSKTIRDGNINEVLPMLASVACRTLGNNRISIWILNEGGEEHIECLYAFDKHQENMTKSFLYQKDFPKYFEAIKGNHIVQASDVYQDPQLEEFVEGYFKPLQICSMLDAPFFLENRVAGVICCENRFEKHEWIPEDSLFLQSLCDLISITFKNKETKRHLEQIHTQNLELRGQRAAMEEMNHELSTINEMLEEKVKDRTAVLESRNKQLTEYAFINSHLLRAPLARVLGLSYLLVQSVKGKEDDQVVNGLINASEELDSIIKKISDLLYDGNEFSRADVEEIIRKNFEKK